MIAQGGSGDMELGTRRPQTTQQQQKSSGGFQPFTGKGITIGGG